MECHGNFIGNTSGHSGDIINAIEKITSAHLLIVPMVQQAHASSAFRFAKKLSKRGVTITLVMIREHADELHRVYTREALQMLSIRIEALDNFQRPQISSPLHQHEALKAAFHPFAEKLIAKNKAGLPGPTCLLADRFLTWIENLAEELDIPRYSYASNAAVTLRLMQVYHEIERELKALPSGPDFFQNSYELIRKQPGLGFLKKASDIPDITIANGWVDFYCDIGRGLSSTDGIVFNSFYALEHELVVHIRNGSTKRNVAPVYPIGPLATVEEFNNLKFVGGLVESHAECAEWLNAQPSQSVLYICLGSQVRIFGEQITVLARALEGSQHRFLWILSKGRGNFSTVEEVLPPGYSERVSGRGKIVSGWVGQLQILSNPAIGGFLSHCGWQSVIESLTCGVPILGWPQIAEQRLNCRYLQDVLKVGMRITEKESQELVEQHEFEEAIKAFMSGTGRTAIATNAANMKSMAAAAVAQGGTSDVALDQFIESLCSHKRRE